MSDPVVIDNQGVGTEDQNKEVQTVPIEQFEELKEKFELSQKSNSGLDSKITELQKLFKTTETERENEKKTSEQKRDEAVAEIKAELAASKAEASYEKNKGLVTQMLIDASLPVPRGIGRLVGETEEETLKYVKDYIADRQDEDANAKSKTAKKFSRVMDDTNKKSQDKMSWEDINKLSRKDFEELEKQSPELVKKAMEAAIGAK